MLTTPAQPAGRISQLLPTVKCSSCGSPVPLADLGDHVCAPAPPMPIKTSSPNLPKPVLSPTSAASLLPQRLQGLVAPANLRNPAPAKSPLASQPPSQPPARDNRLNINPGATRGAPPSAPRAPSRDPYASGGESPVRNRPPGGGFMHARSGSNTSAGSPTTTRPSFSSAREMPPRQVPSVAAIEATINTQSGGEAGMAGVGRRGFAAAARAAMFAQQTPAPAPASVAPPPIRASAPRNIDTSAATSGSKSSTTPPLSTSTGSSGSPGIAPYPESPVSQKSWNRRSRSPSSRNTKLQSSASVSSRGSSKPSNTSKSSESAYGLAYADETDYEDYDDDDDSDLRRANARGYETPLTRKPPAPLPLPASSSGRSDKPTASSRGDEKRHIKSKASMSDGEGSDYGDSGLQRSNSSSVAQTFETDAYDRRGGPGNPISRGHSRGSSGGSGHSAYSSRSARATGGEAARGSGKGSLLQSTEKPRDLRSRSPDSRSRSPDPRARFDEPPRTAPRSKTKICVRCEKKIDDGKWVAMDGGGVLCEMCWKNMYLPKCRRCNKPIEKQAVSSSDGQLKGKYHRECFNCATCHKPFPDKTFYVLDDKPLCAYHYHEANDSLCAAATCGQGIEGPCAVSHTGDRYHPEHMLCEYQGGCEERLEDYWEVDGRMLCERHSRASRLMDEEDDLRRPGRSNTRARKRMTKYINLGGR